MVLERVDLDMQYQGRLKLVVFMITYNHESYIEQAIESVMSQRTTFDFKLYIGEDYSTDNTRAICAALKNKYPDKIDLFLNETNLGSQKNALNMYNLCYKSGAEYIAILEGDDYWTDPLKLQKQVDFLESNTDYGLCFTRFNVKNEKESLLGEDKNGHYFNDHSKLFFDFEKFVKGWHLGLATLVFRAISFDVNVINKYKYFKDIHLITELLIKGKGVCLNLFTTVYRIHEGGVYSSSTLLERAKTGSICYKELYFNNKEIHALKIKYRYFHRCYIKELIHNKYYWTALSQTLIFGLYMEDISFIRYETKRIINNMIFIKKSKG